MAAPSNSRKSKGRVPRKGSAGVHADQKGKPRRKAAGKAHPKKKDKGPKKLSRQELGRQVSQELVKLRPILKEVGTALLDRLDGELAVLAVSLGGESLPGGTPVLPNVPALLAMLADIKALKVKPKKGRVKDLARIEALLESLSVRIPPEA